MQENKKNQSNNKRVVAKEPMAAPGALCLTPAMNDVLNKMKSWMSSIIGKKEPLASSEVNTTGTDLFQPLFQNDYAPPVVKKEIDSIPSPTGVTFEQAGLPSTLRVSWNKTEKRQLFLVQVNVENPKNPSCWITHSVSTQPFLEIEDIETDKTVWVRVCALGNDGRSKWTLAESQPAE
jgi:hypothetical protein